MTVFPASAAAGKSGKAWTGTATTTMSPATAASPLVAADARGPSSATVSASVSGPRELLSTTWYPASMASRAMALPICPLPMNPTVVIFSASLQKSRTLVMCRIRCDPGSLPSARGEVVAVVQIGEQAGLSGFPAEGPAGDEVGRRVALRDYVREKPEVSRHHQFVYGNAHDGQAQAAADGLGDLAERDALVPNRATWMTPSESAAASMSPSRSWRSPRRTFAPSADTAAAAVSDRARPVTSCPAAMSSGMMYEPVWPVPPVTKTRMLLLLVKDAPEEMAVRARSAENADAEGEVEVPHAVAGQAHRQRPDPFQPAGYLQAADIERTQSEALDERRHTRVGPRVISGEEHVQRTPLGQDVAEDGVERLHDVRARRDGLGDLLRAGNAIRSDQPGGVGVEGVGDVDDDLAGQRIAVFRDH